MSCNEIQKHTHCLCFSSANSCMLAFGLAHRSCKLLTKVMGDCLLPKPSYSGYSCFLFPTHIFPYGDFGKFLSDFVGKCRKLSLVEGCLLLSPILLLTSGKDLAWKGELTLSSVHVTDMAWAERACGGKRNVLLHSSDFWQQRWVFLFFLKLACQTTWSSSLPFSCSF